MLLFIARVAPSANNLLVSHLEHSWNSASRSLPRAQGQVISLTLAQAFAWAPLVGWALPARDHTCSALTLSFSWQAPCWQWLPFMYLYKFHLCDVSLLSWLSFSTYQGNGHTEGSLQWGWIELKYISWKLTKGHLFRMTQSKVLKKLSAEGGYIPPSTLSLAFQWLGRTVGCFVF